ncbi:hypothetical protein MBLNU459_g7630t2 [Dothideomycetes sp. NU459]
MRVVVFTVALGPRLCLAAITAAPIANLFVIDPASYGTYTDVPAGGGISILQKIANEAAAMVTDAVDIYNIASHRDPAGVAMVNGLFATSPDSEPAQFTDMNFEFHMKGMSEKAFDGSWRILSKHGHKDEAISVALSYLSTDFDSIAAHLRAGDSCEVTTDAKVAMYYYAQAIFLALRLPDSPILVLSACTKGIMKCSRYTEIGAFFREDEIEMWQKNRFFFCQTGRAFEDSRLRKIIRDEFASSMVSEELDSRLPTLLSLSSNVRVLAVVNEKLYAMPRFFRWLLPFRLAIMSTPRNREDVEALKAHKLTLIVTLTEEGPLPAEWFTKTACRNVFIPVRNYHSPSILQVESFIKLIDDLPDDEAALIHCGGGKGRAGTLAACYLMARGFNGKPAVPEDNAASTHIFPADAIRLLRHLRPGSIETTDQENFVKLYAKHLAGSHDLIGFAERVPQISETQQPLQLTGELPPKPSLIICCGIPGSGKSTFSAVLAKCLGYVVISQDELGSRAACLSALAGAIQTKEYILVDRCNPYPEDRKEWIDHAFNPSDALCVWFDPDRELCIQRADLRSDHPTIAQGRARKIVMSFSKTLVQPSLKEKFACVARVPSSGAMSEILLKLGVPQHRLNDRRAIVSTLPSQSINGTNAQSASPNPEKPFIYKFPRTRHLFNLGAASRDDLILSTDDAEAFLRPSNPSITIVLEEKVDGANLGITADDDSPFGFKVQNRSHYVTSQSHVQFKKLDSWLDSHREGLDLLLRGRNGQYSAGQFVLYGEWLYAKHSINYDHLPDIFLAFDLFNTSANEFLSRQELSKRLAGTDISQVNAIPTPEILDRRSLPDLAKTVPSIYYNGLIEGLYVRRQQDGKTIDRAKIVRSDFISGNDHWSRGKIVQNRVAFEETN